MELDERVSMKGQTRDWWLFLLTGILWLLVSIIVLRFNITSLASVGVLIGAVLIGAGVNEFFIAGMVEGWKWLHLSLGVVFVLGGIWALFHPVGTFYELTTILGFLLMIKGSFDVIIAVATKPANPLWWLGLTAGILQILLAFWVSQQYFAPRAALLLIWVGFTAMFRGISEIVLAFQLHHAGKEMAAA